MKHTIKMLFTLMMALVLLVPGLPAGAAGTAAGSSPMDAVMAVDVSLSMNDSDGKKVSYEAVKMFVDMASAQGDKVGVVAYTDQVLREKALMKLNTASDKQDVKTFIDGLVRGPRTDLAVGVSEAVKVLQNGTEPGHIPIIVLLTDGNNDLPDGRTQAQSDQMMNEALKQAKDKGIPVYTIGLNADGQLNKTVLERIAAETNAKSFVTSSADDLPRILSEIYASHLKLKVVPLQGITANGQYQDVAIDIPNASIQEANISIMSPNPVEVKLFDPNGQPQTIPSNTLIFTSSNAYSLLKILNPAQGSWKLQVKGVPKDKININLVYNYDLKLTLEPLKSTVFKSGDEVGLKAYLESGGQKVGDASLYKNLKASLIVTDLDTKQTVEQPLTAAAEGIAGSYKIPEAHDYELKIKVEDANLVRETAPVKITAKSGAPSPVQTAAEAPAEKPGLGAGVWAGIIAAVLAVIAAVLFALVQWRKANRGFFGQMVIEIKDEDTGERTSPQYRKLNTFKGKVTLHQLLQLAPEFAETSDLVLRPGPSDTLLVQNRTPAVIEKGGRVFDAAQPKEVRAGDRLRVTLSQVNKSIMLEYIK
ncbi:vWA domain-containing protein [Paenibacillus sp. S-38]|uniref:vWA domain-containing protein n=1 Tax=Paenibacillus sp. S-38 TaxID=3416710 RepID=UPI003CF6CDAE